MEKKYDIQPGIYRHYKGNRYQVLGTAYHSETLEEMVVYKALYADGDVWVRPACMWDETVISEGKEVKRFKLEDSDKE